MKIKIIFIVYVFFNCLACKKGNNTPYVSPEGERYGDIFTGGEYHLGPVDWAESKYTNAFGPYPKAIQDIEGKYLAGLELTHNGKGQICDACVKINTDKGKSLVLRVITTGSTTKNSIDVSPEAYAILNSGEYPRSMSWYVIKCPDNGRKVIYQFKSGAHQYWAAFWARNVALPLNKVEIKSKMHSSWFTLRRETDGSYVDSLGFRNGAFSIRLTAIDGSTIEDTYQSFTPGGLLESSAQF